VDGNVYVDLTGAFGVSVAGHANPVVGTAVEVAWAAGAVHAMGDVHPHRARVALLERLTRRAPWSDARGVLANSGSEAVEIALKTAALATDRPGVLAFGGGYHGLTLGSLAVTARDDFRRPFRDRLHGAVAFVDFPEATSEAGDRALDAVDRALDTGVAGAPIGTIIVEPIQGRGGIRVPPEGFLDGLLDRARAVGALVIYDEIFTGMGRTGRFWAHEWDSGPPDLLVAGKALGGGLPLSVCLAPAGVMDAWPASEGEALHTSTFLGHPLACAAAGAFLDELESRRLVERADSAGRRWLEELRETLAAAPRVSAIRGRGMMLGIEVADPESGEPQPGGGVRVAEEALARGLVVLPAGERGEVVELTPPLVITEQQMALATATLGEILTARN
jgi:4-aminobutyrate aminotransferase-like enzyme